jgi:hypothetical protein
MEHRISELKAVHHACYSFWYATLAKNEASANPKKTVALELFENLKFDGFDYWLGEPEKEAELNKEFAVFGKRRDGSTAAVWLLDTKKLSESPVVLIGSEGELGIISPNYLTFIALAAAGFDMFRLLDSQTKPLETSADANSEMMAWLESEFGTEIPEDIQAAIAQARSQNPDIEKYVF